MQRGQIFLRQPDSEGKQRPVVVISRDDLNVGHSVLCVPFYSQQLEKRKRFKTCVFFTQGTFGLGKDCVAKCDEITLVDKINIDVARGAIGRVDAVFMDKIVKAVRHAIRCDDLTPESPARS